MPTISKTLSAAHTARWVDAMCGIYSYLPTIDSPEGSVPNPETKQQFANRMHGVHHFKEVVNRWDRIKAQSAYVDDPIDPQ